MRRSRAVLRGLGTALAVLTLSAGCSDERPREDPALSGGTPQTSSPEFVTSAVCAECHAEVTARWRGSHHDLAMQEATAATARGDFSASAFEHLGAVTRFRMAGDELVIETSDLAGEPRDFAVRYLFGFEPLEQYLLELPGGRLQAFSAAWDTRPAADGGQRWFHLYGDEPIPPSDVLHWTQASQNWNSQCAECHSTGLVKNYDLAEDRFATRWAEIDVACEACHGAGSRHVAWARSGASPDAATGLGVVFDDRAGISWQLDPETGNSKRSAPRRTEVEISVCASCHSRRARLAATVDPAVPFLDAHLPALVSPPLYYADGQVRDEVYVYGSFLQSRMYQQGVTCSDCHEPHSLALRAAGSEVCAQCHAPAVFARTEHHLHAPESAGADCVECHMPPTTYMEVDARHDHSFRIPRPLLERAGGGPDACVRCHTDRDADWAAEILAAAGKTRAGPSGHWTERLVTAQGPRGLAAREAALELALDESVPPIIRASALGSVAAGRDPIALTALERLATATQPLLRLAAARNLSTADPATAVRIGSRLLDDPLLAVRLDALSSLAPLGTDLLSAAAARRLREVAEEFVTAQQVNAERPTAHVNLGNLSAALGDTVAAEAAYRTAIRIGPEFVPAYVNLADLYRALGREVDGEAVLTEGLERHPAQPVLHYSLGLLRVRQGRMDEAIAELASAAQAPDAEPRFSLAHALALDAQGQNEAALGVLAAARERYGEDEGLVAAEMTLRRR